MVVVLALGAVLLVGLGVDLLGGERVLVPAAVVVCDARRLLVAVRGVVDQILLGQLEALGLALSALDDRALGRIEALVAGDAADRARLLGGRVDLLLLSARLLAHPLSPRR